MKYKYFICLVSRSGSWSNTVKEINYKLDNFDNVRKLEKTYEDEEYVTLTNFILLEENE